MRPRKVIVVLKGYPRLSETFIAQELLGLEKAGFDLTLVSLRRPTDAKRHPIHDEIRAPVMYLPEYLHEEPLRVLKGLINCWRKPGFKPAFFAFLGDFRRDISRNRIRRFGQALVLAAEWPDGGEWLHAHFIHTPASVTAYASIINRVPWTCSAHAKDIWTSPAWELEGKLANTRWAVTCTHTGFDYLRSLSPHEERVHLSYHGLDLSRFDHFAGERLPLDGSDADRPVNILSVGRAVTKKGYDVLLRAFALLPKDLHWRFEHIGAGEQQKSLKILATELGISRHIEWRGALAQKEVLERYRNSDIFTLACRIAPDGDRDGLPNVLVEASSQRLVCVSTDVSGVPELLSDGENGFVVPSENPQALAKALEKAIRNPDLRRTLGDAAEAKVRSEFDHNVSIRQLKTLFENEWKAA
ncbi:glycosyltransferase involved in cell wall biosynthesis [Pararhizobium capsulatum DSM 1112]|uniref:Glycosyltransferase involved in cell wall biosynthesis n=1 Tax=Pararhizobium capsulatum DSM 1112 TaxID=1121113 RepID=A0ABU0BUV7_9HYPH|nr:glycosyltransferase [Pararhizobium capsulatum]MDQ0321489.1 glycosyltransferase involved in cell wall biosynthesis [Pararhizobium capsulatum DSM 1112]